MRIRQIQAAVLLCLILALPIRTSALPAFYFPPKLTATTTTTAYTSHNLHVRQDPGTFTPTTSTFPAIVTSIETISPDPRTSTTVVPITTLTTYISPTTNVPATTPATDIPTASTTDISSAAPTIDITTIVSITGEPSTRISPTLLPPISTLFEETTLPTPGTLTTSTSSNPSQTLTSTSSNPSQTPTSTSLTGTTTSSGILSSTGISSVTATISGSETFLSVTPDPSGTATATPGPEPPLTSGNSRIWIIVGGAAAAVLLLALICFFAFQRRRQKREKRRLFNINGGLDSLTSINRASVGGDDQEGRDDDDDDDLDSEKAFFMANPPPRVRSPQSPHPDNHDLNIKTPLDQYEAQKFNWPTPIVVTDKHPQDHIRQHHLQRLLELQQEQLVKLNALVERYRVTYSRPQSPHSPVLSETRLSTRLSYFGVDDQLEFEDEEQLTSEEIRRLELKGDERLEDVPLEEGPFGDKGEIDDGDVELQSLEVSHYYHGPFADQDEQTSAPLINVFDDPNAVFEADFEVASIIIRSGSTSLLSDSLELPDEREQRDYDKGKGITSSIRDSDSFLGLPLSTRASTDDLRAEFGSYRDSNSTLAASSTVRERHSDITMDESSTEYTRNLGSSSGSGSGGGSSHGSGSGSGSGTTTAVAAPTSEKCDRPTPTGIQTGVSSLDGQREREQNEILLKAIEQVKAQYAEQYRQIHEDLANLQLE